MLQDLRYGLRLLAKSPAFTAIAALSLALGIGANTAIFSMVNAIVLKPIPVSQPERIASVFMVDQRNPGNLPLSHLNYKDLRDQNRVFSGMAAIAFTQLNWSSGTEAEQVQAQVVSGNYFSLLGAHPALGRGFLASEDEERPVPVVVISHGFWQRSLGGDAGVIGRTLTLNRPAFTVIGVAPKGFTGTLLGAGPAMWVPMSMHDVVQPNFTWYGQRRGLFLFAMGRLLPGVSIEQASANVKTVFAQLEQAYPNENKGRSAGAVPLLQARLNPQGDGGLPIVQISVILMTVVGIVLLIACANVANLLLARANRRRREIAVRLALGANRVRLVRQLLTESTLLAVIGGALGVTFAWVTIDMLTTFVGRFTSRTGEITIDPLVLVFTLGVSVVTGLLFGTLPALGSRVDLVSALKQGGNQSGDSGRRKRMQGALIVAQVAVSVVLLVGAGLLLASFYRLQRVETGYRSDGVLSAQIFGNFSRYPTIVQQRNLYLPVLERLQSAPGVNAVAITNAVPLGGGPPGQTRFTIEGRAVDDPERRPTADVRAASPQYFATLGIPQISGRTFTELDNEEAQRVVVINKAMTRYWDGSDPVGSRIELPAPASGPGQPPRTEWWTVIGVVGDVRQFGLAQETVAQVYVPLRQTPFGVAGQVLVRTAGDPAAFGNTLRAAVRAVDPNQPVEQMQTLDDLRTEALAAPRLTATLLAVFAALAMLVTLAGIGGVIATSVTQRTKEFGLRMALGARRDSVLLMVVRQGLTLVVVGLVIGVAGALAAGRVLSSYLYQTAPRDPVIFIGVAAVFILAGIIACVIPARRATTVDPLIALRAE